MQQRLKATQDLYQVLTPEQQTAGWYMPDDDAGEAYADAEFDAENLAARGVKEIIITGQDTTAYGKDLKSHPRLAQLLKEMARIRRISWIRLLYAHPAHISKDVMEAIATENKICSYIDLPIQHIDDHILKSMNRRISGAEIKLHIFSQTESGSSHRHCPRQVPCHWPTSGTPRYGIR